MDTVIKIKNWLFNSDESLDSILLSFKYKEFICTLVVLSFLGILTQFSSYYLLPKGPLHFIASLNYIVLVGICALFTIISFLFGISLEIIVIYLATKLLNIKISIKEIVKIDILSQITQIFSVALGICIYSIILLLSIFTPNLPVIGNILISIIGLFTFPLTIIHSVILFKAIKQKTNSSSTNTLIVVLAPIFISILIITILCFFALVISISLIPHVHYAV